MSKKISAAAPSIKVERAAIRMQFDWLVVEQIIAVNPVTARLRLVWALQLAARTKSRCAGNPKNIGFCA
jgi:hypothetical protein